MQIYLKIRIQWFTFALIAKTLHGIHIFYQEYRGSTAETASRTAGSAENVIHG